LISLFKPVCLSLSLHALVALGLYAWPLPSAERVTFSGSRSVVTVEAVQSQLQVPVSVEFLDELLEEDRPLPEPTELSAENRSRDFAFDLAFPVSLPTANTPTPAPHPKTLAGEFESPKAKLQRTATKSSMPDPRDQKQIRLRNRTMRATPPAPTSIEVEPSDAGMKEQLSVDFSGNPPPIYPAEAVRQRLEGTVLIRIHVDELGSVEAVDVIRSSGHLILDKAAVKAVRGWKGEPATTGQAAVASIEVLPIRFRLQ